MSDPSVADGRAVTPEVLERVVEVASRAPSVHNTQPWRWRGSGAVLELYADRTHQLPGTDPDGRSLVLSCGAALHHAQVAAAAQGWATAVARHPDPQHPDLLARLTLSSSPPPAAAAEALAALEGRHTDRRPFISWPVPEERLAHLARVANEWGARAVPLTDATERFLAERLVRRSADRQRADAAVMAELPDWMDRTSGTDEEFDGLVVFFDSHDDAPAWLLAGEGLSAMWLAATIGGLSVVPLTQVIEVAETRRALQAEVLGGLAHPLVLARVGWQAVGQDTPLRTPRRAVSEIFEMG